jgi:hypothetical protein
MKITKKEKLIIYNKRVIALPYKGNIGFEEMVKFYQKANDSQIELMENSIKNNDWESVKELFKKILNVNLQ